MNLDSNCVVSQAQQDMRHAYFGGAPGILASALAWLVAGIVAMHGSAERAVWALFIGGMFIHPLGVLLAKALGRPGAHARGNPLGVLALEGTVLLMLCLPLAFAISLFRVEWFFPAMLLVIGGRYLTFSTLYGMRLYWGCGAALAIAAFALPALHVSPPLSAISGAAIELIFAVLVFAMERGAAAAPALQRA